MTLSPRIGLTPAPAGVVRGTRDEEALDGLQSSVVPHGSVVDAAYESQPRPALLEPVAAAAVHLDENTGRSASRSARRARLTSRWLVVGGWTSRADWVVEVVRRLAPAVAVPQGDCPCLGATGRQQTADRAHRRLHVRRRLSRLELADEDVVGHVYAAPCPSIPRDQLPLRAGEGDMSPAAHGMTKSLAAYTQGRSLTPPAAADTLRVRGRKPVSSAVHRRANRQAVSWDRTSPTGRGSGRAA